MNLGFSGKTSFGHDVLLFLYIVLFNMLIFLKIFFHLYSWGLLAYSFFSHNVFAIFGRRVILDSEDELSSYFLVEFI